jgi:hypothetical protein
MPVKSSIGVLDVGDMVEGECDRGKRVEYKTRGGRGRKKKRN